MKTTDNMKAQIEDLQQTLVETATRCAKAEAQRDAALAALRDLRNRIVAEKPDCINTTKADAVIAAAEKGQ